jgi:hypothetical protein
VVKSSRSRSKWPIASPMSRFPMSSSSSSIFSCLAGRAYRWFWHCDCHSFFYWRIQFHRIWEARWTQRTDVKVQTSNRQVHLLIQTCEGWSEGS